MKTDSMKADFRDRLIGCQNLKYFRPWTSEDKGLEAARIEIPAL